MKKFKKIILCLLVLITNYTYGQDGQSAFYQRAAQLLRNAAAKTKCPERAKYLIRVAEWNECMVDLLAGRKSSCPNEPSLENTPPCDGDMIGGGANNSTNQGSGTQQQNQQGIQQNVKTITDAATDIFNAMEEAKRRKEEYWNSLSPEEQKAIMQANQRADSIKLANRMAIDQKEAAEIARHNSFSVGIYGATENRDFIANDLSEFYNQDGYGSSIPVLSNIEQPTGYNLGLNFQWIVDFFGVGDQTRRGLFTLGLYYVTYSAPMIINQNNNQTITYNGNVAMLKFESIRIAPTLSFRLFRLGGATSLSGVFFQYGLKADYMFSATANPVKFDGDANTSGYNSVLTTYDVTDHFDHFEWGIICGLRLDLSRHFSINLQYDLLGGLNDKILKPDYSLSSYGYYTFQEKHKTIFGLGIYF